MYMNNSRQSLTTQDKKNIKNIYVHKINSLIKLSKDTLIKDDLQTSNNNEKKKINKISSEIDRNTLKLQKNRQSAKKARLRKKIYIKMLESQIQSFKKIKNQGDQLNQQAETFLSNQQQKINNNEINEYIQHDVNVDKFLFGNNFGEALKIENQEVEKKLIQRDTIVEELYQLSTSGLVKKLKQNKNLEVFQPILKRQARQNMQIFQHLIKRIVYIYDNIKNSFRKIQDLTQKSKNLTRKCRKIVIQQYQLNNFYNQLISVAEFMEKLNLNRQDDFESVNESKTKIQDSFTLLNSTTNITNGSQYHDLNLHTIEKLLIRSEKFFQHTLFQQQQ